VKIPTGDMLPLLNQTYREKGERIGKKITHYGKTAIDQETGYNKQCKCDNNDTTSGEAAHSENDSNNISTKQTSSS